MSKTAPPNACLALADGTLFWGRGFGATGTAVGELCFNTAMTGYQEIMTDPCYAGQLVTFTFPHIGNTGAHLEDDEALIGCTGHGGAWIRRTVELAVYCTPFDWLARQGRVAIGGIDTRRLTRTIRQKGMPHAAIGYAEDGVDANALIAAAKAFSGLEGLDLAKGVSCTQSYQWDEQRWAWPGGFPKQTAPRKKVVAVDFGAKRNILRCLAEAGAEVTGRTSQFQSRRCSCAQS